MPAPRQPKYRTIADDLTASIRAGTYAPGQALPPQRELSGTYGVTLATLRQALAVLQDGGLVSQQAGRGTFVTEPRPAYRLDTLNGLEEDLQAQGHTVTTEILDQAPAAAPGPVAARLGLDAGTRVLRLERLRFIAGRPAVHQVSWVPGPAAQRLLDVDLSGQSLYAALVAAGAVVEEATETLRPGCLDERTAALLRRPAGEPVFCSERWSGARDGTPAVLDEAVILGSAMEVRSRRSADGLSLRWTRPGPPG